MTIKTLKQGRRSIMRIEELNVFSSRKKQALVRGLYGALLVGTSILLMALDPVDTITKWCLRMEQDSFIFNMWKEPPYDLYLKAHVFNYTNVAEFLSGEHTKLRVEDVGPFIFQEKRTNLNMTVDTERQILRMTPNVSLKFLPEKSVGDTKNMRIIVPNLALIALSTLAADELPWWTNQLANTLIRLQNPDLFLNLTVEEYLWGYRDPLVSIAGTIAPGWIDFSAIGILDRFYDQKKIDMEVELSNKNGNQYSILKYGGSEGLKEQGFKDVNTSTPCNLIKGAYEGIMLNPGISKDTKFSLFRKQACRVYPFRYENDGVLDSGVPYYRYSLEDSSFNSSSPYACACNGRCLPDGFVDIAKCFYNFPVALTKPHFMDVDPREVAKYEGLHPDKEKHHTFIDFEPTLSIPVKIQSSLQANIAVRTSRFNPITLPLNQHILPLLWLSMYCENIPHHVNLILQLRILYGPPAVIALEVILMIIGCWLIGTGLRSFIIVPELIIHLETKPIGHEITRHDDCNEEYDNDKVTDALI